MVGTDPFLRGKSLLSSGREKSIKVARYVQK
jgi:hypothetical protein